LQAGCAVTVAAVHEPSGSDSTGLWSLASRFRAGG
jgi:hypothetical protein